MTMTLSLSIAGFVINIVFTDSEWPDKRDILLKSVLQYSAPFRIEQRKKCDAQITVVEISGIPFLKSDKKTYSQCFEKIHKTQYRTYYHVSIFEISQLLLLVLISLLEKKGFLLHASGVFTKTKVALFIGPSKTGKSTVIKALGKKYRPFADDCVAIKKEKDGYVCYQVPWVEKNPALMQKSPNPHVISSIYTIKKHSSFAVRKLDTTQTVQEVVKNAWVINTIEKDTLKTILSFVDKGVNGLRLDFALDKKNQLIQLVSSWERE